MAARNMQIIEINIHKKIVRQFGYLQRLYRDARSTERKEHKKDVVTVHALLFPKFRAHYVNFFRFTVTGLSHEILQDVLQKHAATLFTVIVSLNGSE
jgi:hypothetical protein